MKRRLYSLPALAVVVVLFAMTAGRDGTLTSHAAVTPVTPFTGSALLDDWGNRFAMLGTIVNENPLRK